jgi:hypothetical protein
MELEFFGQAPFELEYKDSKWGIITRNITGNSIKIASADTGTFTFTFNYLTDGNGCSADLSNTTDNTVKATVRVNSLPTVTMENQTICYGGSAKITVTGKAPFDIQFRTKRNGESTGTFNRHIDLVDIGSNGDVWIASEDTGTYEFELISIEDANCINRPSGIKATVRVNPLTTVRMSGLTEGKDTICLGESKTLVFTGVAPFNLVFRSNGEEFSKTNIMTNTLAIPSEATGSFGFKLVSLTDASGCTFDAANSTDTADIFVRPLPEASIASADICQGDSITLNYTGTMPWGFTYNNGTGEKTLSGITTAEYKFKSTLTGTFNITSISDVYGCTSTVTGGNTITVKPLPTVEVISNQSVCLGEKVALIKFTGTQPWTVTYNDGTKDTTVSGITSSPYEFEPTAAGTYMFNLKSVSDATSCINTLNTNVTVTVNPLPTASIIPSQSLCLNESTGLITLTGKAPWTLTYNNGTKDTTVSITSSPYVFNANATGTYTFALVSVSDANNCVNNTLSGNATITVNPLPEADTKLLSASICLGENVDIIDIAGSAGPWTVTYDNGTYYQTIDAIAASPYNFKPTGEGVYTFILAGVSDDLTGCTNTAGGSVIITVNPLPTASIAATQTLCEGGSVDLITLTGTQPWTVVYNDGTKDTTVSGITSSPYVFNANSAGTYNFTLVSVSDVNCTNTTVVGATATITVNPLPVATTGVAAADTAICLGTDIDLINITGSTGPWTITYYDATGIQTLNVTSSPYKFPSTVAAGDYIYNLVSVVDDLTGCIGTATGSVRVTVNPLPTASISTVTQLCLGDSVELVKLTGKAPWEVGYELGGVVQTPLSINESPYFFNPTEGGSYAFKLLSVKDANSCSATSVTGNVTINVDSLPVAKLTPLTSVCANAGSINLIEITGGQGPWEVTYDSNNVSQTVTITTPPYWVIQPSAGTYNFILRSVKKVGGCTGTISGPSSITITVNSLPTAILAQSQELCIGEEVELIELTGNAPWTVTYDSNNVEKSVSVASSPYIFKATTAGTYTFNLKKVKNAGANGCETTYTGITTAITVNPSPAATFVPAAPATICLGDSVPLLNLTNLTSATQPWKITYHDGTATHTVSVTSSPYRFKPTVAGSYTISSISIVDAKGCSSTISGSVTVTVNPQPTATVLVTSPQTICAGDSVAIVSVTGGTGPWTLTYNTNQTLTTSSSLFWVKPTTTTPYILNSVRSNSNCSTPITATITVIVNPLPTASMLQTSAQTICLGDSVSIISVTGGTVASPCTLTYSDGTRNWTVSGITASPYTYRFKPDAAGTYTISLVSLSNGSGCVGTRSGNPVVVTVNPRPTATVIATNQTICASDSVAIVNLTGTAPWTVTYNDGAGVQTIANIMSSPYRFKSTVAGTHTFDLVSVSDANGNSCSNTATGSVTITVIEAPAANLLVSTQEDLCVGVGVDLIDLTGTGPWTVIYDDGTGVHQTISGITTSPYQFTPTTVRSYTFDLVSVSNTFCSVAATGSTIIVAHALSTATLTYDQTITLGESVELIKLNGEAPWDVIYNDGTNDVTLSGITESPYVFTPDNAGDYSFTLVSVMNARGCVNTITGETTVITVKAVLDNDASLIDLSVSEGTLDPVFNATVFDYKVNVTHEIDSISIFAQASNPNAKITGTGRFELQIGVNIFHVEVEAEDGMTKQTYTVVVYRAESVGIEFIEVSETINVYPNPTYDILNVVSDLQIKQIDFYDINGKVVKRLTNPEQSISVANLSKGVYMLQIQTDKGIAVKKITKQ